MVSLDLGPWGLWSLLGPCSVSCGTGMSSRYRNCKEPHPTDLGEYCYGNSIEYKLCTEASCSSWTPWSPWSPCSNTCGAGLRLRERNCTGAGPDMINLCPGDAHDFEACETKCQQKYEESTSAFSASCIQAYNGHDVRFATVLLKQGGDYNSTTGYFTCRIPGIYQFSLTIQQNGGDTHTTTTQCYIRLNNANKVYVRTFSSTNSNPASSASAILHLSVGDKVHVGHCSLLSTFYQIGINNIFSGFLITKDN